MNKENIVNTINIISTEEACICISAKLFHFSIAKRSAFAICVQIIAINRFISRRHIQTGTVAAQQSCDRRRHLHVRYWIVFADTFADADRHWKWSEGRLLNKKTPAIIRLSCRRRICSLEDILFINYFKFSFSRPIFIEISFRLEKHVMLEKHNTFLSCNRKTLRKCTLFNAKVIIIFKAM